MKLSVILVNHNSCNGLRLALTSVLKAGKGVEHEVIVVDNGSEDGSRMMLVTEYPHVRVIVNNKEESLSKANNQAIRRAKGEYVLLLNPDTISGPDTLAKLIAFMDQHPVVGGASVKMVDQRGDFLSQSKHSLNGTWAAFLKLIGLSAYFPKTFSIFRRSDWTEEFETAEVDTLNANCMLLRRSVLNQTGLFDERFYRFGHNIDLSYRIRQQGYKNYYYSKTYIIQLQGKNASKFSWDHIKHFYGAMFIFAAKYLFNQPVPNTSDIGEIYPSSYEIE